VTSDSTVVAPGPATTIVVQLTGDIVSGEPFAVEVDAHDFYGNVAAFFNGPVIIGLTSGSAEVLSGTLTGTVTDGTATLTNLVVTTSGPISFTARSGTLTSPPSASVPVSPAVAAHLVIETQPSQTATAGQAFTTQPVIEEVDQYGNLETGDNSTVVTASLGSGIGPLLGTTSVVLSGGVARFTNLAGDSAGDLTLAFRGGSLTTATSGAIHVTPGPTSTPPTIIGEQVELTYLKHNKKGKPIGKPVVSIVLNFSTAMDAGTVGNPNNYQVASATTKKGKRILHPLGILSATPNASRTSVTLATSATTKAFAKGGQIMVNYTQPNGVSSAAGLPLAANDAAFTIAPKATGIIPG
jgi:hypothetical protein